MAKKPVEEYRKELEELSPTIKEVEQLGEGYNLKFDEFITDNVWRDKSNHHIHIGFTTDLYLNAGEAKEFIKQLKENRRRQNKWIKKIEKNTMVYLQQLAK